MRGDSLRIISNKFKLNNNNNNSPRVRMDSHNVNIMLSE